MAAELVSSATSEKLAEVDWTKNIEISELVARDQRQAKDVVKEIKKRLQSKKTSTQLYAVLLLEILMNNIGDPIHRQVIDMGILPILVKIVKKKTDLPVRERIFILLDATQTSLGGASGRLPQYYSAYYDLVSAGVKFPQRPRATPSNNPTSQPKVNTLKEELTSSRHEMPAEQAKTKVVTESSIIQKATNALEVLREVLDAVDMQNPEGAKDEFTLDLVEQCSFQKEKVMHLVMTSRDEKLVSRAIELNDQLQKVLDRHGAILSRSGTHFNGFTATANHHNREMIQREDINHEEVNHRRDSNYGEVNHHRKNHNHEEVKEEEEAEQLFRRKGKGKACVRPDDEDLSEERPPSGLFGASIPSERLNRPLIRPLSSEPLHEPSSHPSSVTIPPPPSKHMERERFFKEKKSDGSSLAGHMRGLSLHSRNASSSCSGSIDFSD